MRTLWGQSTGELTEAELTRLAALGCKIRAETVTVPDGGTSWTWDVLRSADGGYLGPTSIDEVRAHARWLLAYEIRPAVPRWSRARVAAIGRAPGGGWVGWSHRAAQRFASRAAAEAFAAAA